MICAICTIEFAIEFDKGRCDLAGSPTPWLLQASGKRMLEGIMWLLRSSQLVKIVGFAASSGQWLQMKPE